jgi:hypothetical protein
MLLYGESETAKSHPWQDKVALLLGYGRAVSGRLRR